MPSSRSRTAVVPADEALRLPRPPGVIRQFWARHPLFTDVLIASACLLFTIVPAATFSAGTNIGGSTNPSSSIAFSALLLLVVIAACVLLVWRRRWPIAAFTASVIVAMWYLFLPVPVAGLLLLVTTYTLAVYRSSRACWIGLSIGLGSFTTVALALASTSVIAFPITINAIVFEFVLGLIGALSGINVGNRRRYVDAIIDRSRQLLIERDQQAKLAAAEERARIAREMHDIVSHSLTVVVALSEGAAATPDHERARFAMDAAAATAREALLEMRAMLGVLRGGSSDAPLAPIEPVAPELTVAAAQRAGYPVTLIVTGEATVSQPVRYAIGRIVQEGLTNAMRHASPASAITVRLDHFRDRVVVEVHNDGAAGPGGDRGFGLQGLHERVASVGGSIHSGPSGEGRWLLHAELPTGTSTPAKAMTA